MSDTENLNEAEVEENDLDANQAEAGETEELADNELFSDLDEDLDESDDFDDDLDDETEEQENEGDALQNEEDAENAETDEKVLTETPAKTASGLEKYKAFNTEAKNEFKTMFGIEYDEFDDDHKDALQDIKQVLKKRDNAVEQVKNISSKHGEKFSQFVLDRFEDLPIREMKKIQAAERAGDFSLSLKYIQQFENEYVTKGKAKEKAEKLNAAAGSQTTAKATAKPPRTMSSGTGSEPAKRNKTVLTPEDLGFE
jgi:hypothetical protein